MTVIIAKAPEGAKTPFRLAVSAPMTSFLGCGIDYEKGTVWQVLAFCRSTTDTPSRKLTVALDWRMLDREPFLRVSLGDFPPRIVHRIP